MPSGDAALLVGLIVTVVAIIFGATTLASRISQLLFFKGPFRLRMLLHDFKELIDKSEQRLLQLEESDVESKPNQAPWSKKEILGHLVDEAANSHQLIVRAQLSGEVKFPSYDETAWVNIQGYQNESWRSLVQFWCSYNRHLIHVISSIPSKQLTATCFIDQGEPTSLESLIRDYMNRTRRFVEEL